MRETEIETERQKEGAGVRERERERMKLKDRENVDKHLDIARELQKMWNVRVTLIPFVVGMLGMIPKGLKKKRLEELEIKGKIKTIQPTALLRSARILRRILETREDLLSLRLLFKPV